MRQITNNSDWSVTLQSKKQIPLSAELRAILLALKNVYYSRGKSFLILILFHRYSQY